MTQVELLQLLHTLALDYKKRVFTIRDVAALGGVSRPAAGMALIQAQKKKRVERVRNLWVNRVDPPEILEIAFALASPSYLSFESALYRHGLLSQSPRGALTVATAGRPSVCETTWGKIRFIHLQSKLFFGFDASRIASAEKSFLDLIYLRGLKGRNVVMTEHIHFDRFDQKKLSLFEKRFPSWVREIRKKIGSRNEE